MRLLLGVGHNLCIVNVHFEYRGARGFVNIAEQNHARQTWDHDTYSRKLLLTKKYVVV